MVQEGRGHRKLTAFLAQVKRFLLVLERIGVLPSDGPDGTRSELKETSRLLTLPGLKQMAFF